MRHKRRLETTGMRIRPRPQADSSCRDNAVATWAIFIAEQHEDTWPSSRLQPMRFVFGSQPGEEEAGKALPSRTPRGRYQGSRGSPD